jgi:hypothetical protein
VLAWQLLKVSALVRVATTFENESVYVNIRQHTSAYASIRRHTSAYVSIRQHTSEYVSILCSIYPRSPARVLFLDRFAVSVLSFHLPVGGLVSGITCFSSMLACGLVTFSGLV